MEALKTKIEQNWKQRTTKPTQMNPKTQAQIDTLLPLAPL
jgi:hypothetical protein